MSNNYFIYTYGCQMNVHESEKLAGILRARGYVCCDAVEDADIIVMNTCCVRETAETKVYGHLGRIKSKKKPGAILVVCGCMTQQQGAAQKLVKRCPFIDIVIGTFNLPRLGEYLTLFQTTGARVVEVWESEKSGDSTETATPFRTSGINAWVNIMYGCNNFCTYCIVPYVRGRERCRSIDDIIKDVHNLIDGGYKQITLLGQNVNSYEYAGKNFTDLLKLLDFGSYRLKFMTSHPKDVSPELAGVIANSHVLSHNLHLPVQSGSNAVLAAMNRHYTREQYLKKIADFRAAVPDIGLSSDVMVGFPQESEDDFLLTLDLVERVRYNNLFMFIYSRRSGTPADKMPQLEYSVKQKRIDRLIKFQLEISKQLASSCVGKTYTVLVSDKQGDKCYGKTETDAAVTFTSDSAAAGDFVKVMVTSAVNANLTGEVV